MASLHRVVSETRATMIVLLLLVPLLAFAGYDVQYRVAQSSAQQALIREAQVFRSRILRLQVDEETGVRGYMLTRDPLFLQPYRAGIANFGEQVFLLRNRLRQLATPNLDAIIDIEVQINAIWLREIARPAIANPSAVNDALMRHGKQLIDNFRNRDQDLSAVLVAQATAADRDLARALRLALTLLLLVLLAFAVGGTILSYVLARASRRSFESRILYENQKRIADSLQTAFLQKDLPLTPGIGLHAMYVPATAEAQVGGDWYDAFSLPDGRILFSIGDVAGHGLDAAVVMARARQAIVAAALQENDPSMVLARANNAIMLQESRIVTAICGFIDPATLEIVYATAGHPPPILAQRGSKAAFLPHEGVALGLAPDTRYHTFVAKVTHAALVVFYTDGVIENKRDILAGERRLLEAVEAAVGDENPACAIHHRIFEDGTAPDDVAILTASFFKSSRYIS